MARLDADSIWRVLKKKEVFSVLIFIAAALFAYFMVNYAGPYVSKIGYVVLFIELIIIVAVTWGMAVHTVIKSLFGVGAGLSLVIYLAKSYCEVPTFARSGDDALKSLVEFSLLYIAVEFFRSLYKETKERTKTLKEINHHKNPWLIIVPFGLFTGLFTWQVLQVILPIINTLCVYK